MSQVEYKLFPIDKANSKYPYAVTRVVQGRFNYRYCTQADVDKYEDNLPKLYQVSENNR